MSARGVDPVFAPTTPIRYCDADGGGTGFFVNHQGKTYIVTNRHVVSPEEDDVNPTEAYVWFRNTSDIRKSNRNKIRFAKNDSVRWRDHPEAPTEVDLAIIPINPRLSSLDAVEGEDQQARSGSLAFTLDHIIHENLGVDQHVSIVGYPGDFHDRTTRFPVRRNALIASPYGTPFENRPYFLTDARMHPGTSGSPVVMEGGGLQTTYGDIPNERNKSVYLLGVHSATFYGTPFGQQKQSDIDVGTRDTIQLDLNVAWYPELLRDILESV